MDPVLVKTNALPEYSIFWSTSCDSKAQAYQAQMLNLSFIFFFYDDVM